MKMRKLVLQMQMTVDGFIGGPKGEIDWIFRSMNKDLTDWIVGKLWQAGAHIMGSRTYQDMASYWPNSTEPFAAPMNEIPKVVFTKKGFVDSPNVNLTTAAFKDATRINSDKMKDATGINNVNWATPQIAAGDLAKEINDLKKQTGKNILAHGGAEFARNLVAQNLVDEYRLVIHPIVLARGLSLFSGLTKPMPLKLIEQHEFNSGAVVRVYQPVLN